MMKKNEPQRREGAKKSQVILRGTFASLRLCGEKHEKEIFHV
ncbi:MAG: hypothetical protein PHX38_10010 [Sulfuricella sp.]|nr:hypothetical protein [Sulfuricella sp.]